MPIPLPDSLQVIFKPEGIALQRYPFIRKNRNRLLNAKDLTDIVVGWAPPCVRTVEGEFLFISATQIQALVDFGTAEAIPFCQRVDIWSMILDPFLDTEFDDAYLLSCLKTLEENGIPRSEVERMRKLVKSRMMLLTSFTWEWIYYGLYDVLSQINTFPFMIGWSFSRFYRHAMDLANRGKSSISSPEKMLKLFNA